MSGYPTALYLAVGDTLVPSGSDYVPQSGSYLDLLDASGTGSGIMCLEGGLVIPSSKTPADQKVAGALVRIRAVRSQPIKTITLHLILRSGTADGTSWRARWAQIEHLLEQAAAASGPFGHGTNICLLVRFATIDGSADGANFTAFDVLGGVTTQNDLLTSPGQAYGMTLELRCLMHGRLTAQTYPGINVFTALTNGTGASWYLGTGTSGPIAGHLGALAQVHLKDTSASGAINRIRIGRRNVPGLTGGMGSADWQPIVPVVSALGSAALSAPGGTVGANVAGITLSDTTWQDVASISIPGTQPLHQAGIYDCYLRVRESALVLGPPSDLAVAPATMSALVLPPDTYNVIVCAHSGGSTSVPSSPLPITTTYPYVPDVFSDGFESGDTSQFFAVSKTGSGTKDLTVGELAVSSAFAICGQYGLRSRGQWAFSQESAFINTSSQYVPTAFEQRVIKPFTIAATNQNAVCAAGWFVISGANSNGGSQEYTILELGASALLYANQQETWTGATPGSQAETYTTSGLFQGAVAWVEIFGSQIILRTWASGGGITNTGLPIDVGEIHDQPVWIRLIVSGGTGLTSGAGGTGAALAADGNYVAQLEVYTPGGWAATSTVSGILSVAPHNCAVDYAAWGVRSLAGSGAADLLIDDCQVFTSAIPTSTLPSTGILLTGTDNSDSNGPLVFVQRGAGNYYPYTAGSGHLPWQLDSRALIGTPATVPSVASPAPSNIRPKLGIAGTSTLTTRAPVPTALQNNQWHYLFLGTYALPPVQRMEGLNPANGSGAGDFPFLMEIQAQSGGGTTTVQIDALLLMPHDEPQVVATFDGLDNATLAEWVIDCRRDGRVGCVLRSLSDYTTVVATAEVVGHLELGPGNQILVFLVEQANGVHDPVNTSYGVCMRYQPITDFVDDSPTRF